MKDLSHIDFEDSTVIQFTKHQDIISIILDDVLLDDKKDRICITISGVNNFKTDSKITENDLMPTSDGEILDLTINKQNIKLIIQWNDFELHQSFVNAYQANYTTIDIHASD